MNPVFRHIVSLMLVALLLGCDKAPNDVISESDMAELMADLNLAEAYVDNHSNDFGNDSLRMALKQSVFERHDVDQELYDHSLDWYARNIGVYSDVCDRATRILEERKHDFNSQLPDAAVAVATSVPMRKDRKTYPSRGDSADVWNTHRTWVLTQGLNGGRINWNLRPDDQHMNGDRYSLQFDLCNVAADVNVTLAADYNDGSTATLSRSVTQTGPNVIELQTDTARPLRRIYGYISYKMRPQSVAVIDNVFLLRTHLDRDKYGTIGTQKLVERELTEEEKLKNTAPRVLRNAKVDPTQQKFKPKPGLNNASHPQHIQNSPNASHLPNGPKK